MAIRAARVDDARFIAWAILAASRSQVPRGWFDITLALDETGCLEFIARLAQAETQSWWLELFQTRYVTLVRRGRCADCEDVGDAGHVGEWDTHRRFF